MPHNPDAINSLRRLVLNQYEAKSYFALCTTGKSTAGELAERAEIPGRGCTTCCAPCRKKVSSQSNKVGYRVRSAAARGGGEDDKAPAARVARAGVDE